MTPYLALPEVDTDNMIGVAWVLARSDEPGTIALYQVTCMLQDAPRRTDDILFLGRFGYEDLLAWAYDAALAESGAFESHVLWDMMRAAVKQEPQTMLVWRAVLGAKPDYLERVAGMSTTELAAMFPPLPRAA
jgi:hypothetical protein